jgi:hypothetical protein
MGLFYTPKRLFWERFLFKKYISNFKYFSTKNNNSGSLLQGNMTKSLCSGHAPPFALHKCSALKNHISKNLDRITG